MKKIAYTFLFFVWSFIAFATVKGKTEDLRAYEFYVQELPAVCGSQQEVEKYVEDNNYVAINYSLGREGSQPGGEPVFVLTYWVKEDLSQTMASVQVPNSDQTCILFVTFDVIHNEEELSKKKNVNF